MDSKKANLTPELKEIYDRVMNTSGTPKPAAQNPQPPQQPLPQQNQMPQAPSMLQAPSMPSVGVPIQAPEVPVQNPNPQQPLQQPQLDSAPQMPGAPSVEAPTPAEEALSSTPARPLNEGNTFTFNGKEKPGAKPQEHPGEKKKMAISKPILVVLGLVFIAVWGVFWAIILGVIQR